MLERTFTLIEGGIQGTVTVQIHDPIKEEEDFSCRILISGGGYGLDAKMYGVDSMQAALLAIRLAKRILEEDNNSTSKVLYWLSPENGIDM